MRVHAFCTIVCALWLGTSPRAQDLAGDWQGNSDVGPQPHRIIVRIKRDNAGWTGSVFSIDRGDDWGAGFPISSLTLQNHVLKFAVNQVRATYQGTISADGTSIDGMLTQGMPGPLVLHRATPATAWKDPATHAIQFVEVDKNVKPEILDWGGS